MKTSCQSPDSKHSKGVTLVELSVVISVLVILVSATTFSIGAYKRWQYGLEAGETLKAVYQAQKLYLADNPTENFSTTFGDNDATRDKLIPYMPTEITVANPFPTQVPDEDGNLIDFTWWAVPPNVTVDGKDLSGNDSDGLWDVNE